MADLSKSIAPTKVVRVDSQKEVSLAGYLKISKTSWWTYHCYYVTLSCDRSSGETYVSLYDDIYKQVPFDQNLIKSARVYEINSVLKLGTKTEEYLFLSFSNPNDYTTWQRAIEKSLDVTLASYLPQSGKKEDEKLHLCSVEPPRICSTQIHIWGCYDVAQWLCSLIYGKEHTLLGEMLNAKNEALKHLIVKNNVTGHVLKYENDKVLMRLFETMQIQDEMCQYLMDKIRDLRKDGYAYKDYQLCSVYKKFLQLGKVATKLTFEELYQDCKLFVSVDTITEHLRKMIVNDKILEEQPNQVYKVYINLVLTKIEMSTCTLSSIANNLLTKVAGGKTFGLVHTGVAIHNCLIEWNNSELVLVRPLRSANAILSAPIRHKGHKYVCVPVGQMDSFLRNIAQFIVDWNVHYTYNQTPNLKQKKLSGNCHTFALQLLAKMDVNLSISTLLSSYCSDLRKFGYKGRIAKFSPGFAQQLQCESSREFTTHESLDEFMTQMLKKCPNMSNQFPNEYELLKAFDRGFWINHFQNPENLNAKPLVPCPFRSCKPAVPENEHTRKKEN